MFALMAGFLPAGLTGAKLSSQSILRFFGLALGSTALGLIGRILVIQNGSSTDEDQLQIEAEVAEMARKVAEHAKAIVTDLSSAQAHISEQQAQALEAMTLKAGKAWRISRRKLLSSLTRTSRGLAAYQADIESRHAALSETFDKLDRGAGDQFNKMELIVAAVRDTQSLIVIATNNLAEEVDRLTAALRPLGEQSRAAVAESTENIRQLSRSFNDVAAGQGAVADSLSAMVTQARNAASALSGAQASGQQAAEAAGALARQNEAAGPGTGGSDDLCPTQSRRSRRKDAAAFRRDLDEAALRFGAIVRSFTADLKALNEKVAPQ